jgi:hypothetical protein
MAYLSASDINYAEGAFLAINLTGGTNATNGQALIGLSSWDFSYVNNTADVSTFDLNNNILKVNTTSEWAMSCSGNYLRVSGESYIVRHSGDTRVNGGISTKELLKAVKDKVTTAKLFIRFGPNHYEQGNCVINSISISASAPGEPMEFSLEISGSGALTTSNS